MDNLHYEIQLEAERAKKRAKFEAAGIYVHVCTTCPVDEPLCLTFEHPPGRNRDDTVVLICMNCKAIRDCLQRAEPSSAAQLGNPFELIGRWLLSMAGYFEILRSTLRRFGEWLINLAKAGYGADLTLD